MACCCTFRKELYYLFVFIGHTGTYVSWYDLFLLPDLTALSSVHNKAVVMRTAVMVMMMMTMDMVSTVRHMVWAYSLYILCHMYMYPCCGYKVQLLRNESGILFTSALHRGYVSQKKSDCIEHWSNTPRPSEGMWLQFQFRADTLCDAINPKVILHWRRKYHLVMGHMQRQKLLELYRESWWDYARKAARQFVEGHIVCKWATRWLDHC